MSLYEGIPERTVLGGFTVLKDGNPLGPARSQALINDSPDGFRWGYGGSGPAQLALALLLEETTKEEALCFYQDFKFEVVAGWPSDAWFRLVSPQIHEWLSQRRARA